MRALYWFQTDLRLNDNPGLLASAASGQLLLAFCWPEPRPWCNLSGIGGQRTRFMIESLQALREALAPLRQRLLVVRGGPLKALPALVERFGIDAIATSRTPGHYERVAVEALRRRLDIPLRVYDGNTLFGEQALPFAADRLPAHYTPFRLAVARLVPAAPLPAPTALPPPPPGAAADPLPPSPAQRSPALPIGGGAAAGHRRLQQWVFDQRGIERYEATRNGLDPLDGSSTLSPWLANGSLSVREVAAAVAAFERRHTRNASTECLRRELLWREFFHWRALGDDVGLFRAGGARGKARLATFEPRNFARWCQGDTNYPLVNACMRQLVATGWMSNRGRQLAASCLINELNIDWRYGAAFFEKHLIDHDVASNYGNWQYLAGVGADPRGGRHLDLARQAAAHDPEQLFTTKWGGFRAPQPDYVTDAADWPIMP